MKITAKKSNRKQVYTQHLNVEEAIQCIIIEWLLLSVLGTKVC